jgi:hypothetical protein
MSIIAGHARGDNFSTVFADEKPLRIDHQLILDVFVRMFWGKNSRIDATVGSPLLCPWIDSCEFSNHSIVFA